MRIHRNLLTLLFAGACFLPGSFAQMSSAPAPSASTQKTAPGVLPRERAASLMPQTVFFAGRVASTQARNASGIALPSGKFVVAALVDASGYSSGVQERYQAYLITEAAISVAGQKLPAGAYGCGFVGDKFLVMDVGDHTLFKADASHDEQMKRPVPLEFVADGAGQYRLYAGRNYVGISTAP